MAPRSAQHVSHPICRDNRDSGHLNGRWVKAKLHGATTAGQGKPLNGVQPAPNPLATAPVTERPAPLREALREPPVRHLGLPKRRKSL
eukprot:CAMPEP_0115740928 /NCGR_PEP_ID=MMETSP0272-20121206/89738_1 /TAXON_ID=71861 /ORGANISM="Scrippsiella trochoidea, Strain CCMP3099" /LENGTH=87 /DNA_ID=CAMNT_0003185581 /DNA_START=258 /DNA_END=518 /DNA_ORIENTATION=+